jgi:exodeoxyribonuclease V beta subunit
MTAINKLEVIKFPLYDTRLIEASAGTGKTFTIAALYVRLILNHQLGTAFQNRPLLPPDILVVTFTEAATKELRDRIRARLSTAARFFRGYNEEADPFLTELCLDYPEESQRLQCAQRLELAANWMDEAAVYTIHGWCNRMLKQHAFDSGSLFRLELKPDETELLNQVVRDYWRTFYYALSTENKFLPEIFAEFKTPETLLKVVKDFLIKDDPITTDVLLAKDINGLCESFYSKRNADLLALKAPWTLWAGEMRLLIEKAVADKVLPGKNYQARYVETWFSKIQDWVDTPSLIKLELSDTGFGNLSAQGLDKLTLSGEPPKHPGFDVIGTLPAQVEALPTLKTTLMGHAVQWMRGRASSEKNRLAQMSYNDMLTGLDFALQGQNGAQFAQVIRQQFPIALIDEFQDTDPVQYRIFETLYPPSETGALGCFMIGDPKQAIYSFRGADIFTYLKAYEATKGKHYTLDKNYRSTHALVEGVNQLFEFAEAQQETRGAFLFKKAKDNNPLPFLAVEAQGRKDAWVIKNEEASALTCWYWESTSAVSQDEYRAKMADVTASEIVRLLNASDDTKTGFKGQSACKPLQPNDIAILVRTGKEASLMRRALAKRRLPSVYLSERDSIFARAEATDVLIWLKALADPRNESKVRAALSTATLGFTFQALQAFVVDEISWETQLERFSQYHTTWLQDGILPALRRLINDYNLQRVGEEVGEGERTLTNLLHLAELLQTASAQLEGEPALIRYLAEAIADEGSQTNDENVLRLESDADLIKIVTIHKSKGLEYPLVFLPFICAFREPSHRDSYFKYHDENNTLCVDLNKTNASKVLTDKERLQEDLRLMYVAITRAQYGCWLGIAPIKKGKTSACQLEKSALGYLLAWSTEDVASDLSARLNQMKGKCESIAVTVLPEITLDNYVANAKAPTMGVARSADIKISDNWWIASYSALKHSSQVGQKNLPDEPETAQDVTEGDEAENDELISAVNGVTIYDLPKGAGPGLLIHSLLEQCGRVGFKASLENEDKRRLLIQSLFTQASWKDKTTIIETALPQWLSMPLLDNEVVTLATLDSGHYQVEMEFLMGADKVDLLVVDKLLSQYFYPDQARPKLNFKWVNGLMKGFIDLVFMHNNQYYIADYKFNSLGGNATAYSNASLDLAMLEKRYDLQMVIYVLALHRLLKYRIAEYDYDKHIGGGVYLFLRGFQSASGGRVVTKPAKILIETLDDLFGKRPKGDNA